MPPRKSTRKTVTTAEPAPVLESEPEVSGQYFEIGLADLKAVPVVTSSEPESSSVIEISSSDDDQAKCLQLSRKVRLQLRRVHLMAEMAALRLSAGQIWKPSELAALAVSMLPAHILRIFDPVSLRSAEGGKSLKNCVGMLATWWKNNFGLRMTGKSNSVDASGFKSLKTTQLKAALLNKSAYEDDFVLLFSLILFTLGVKVRIVHSMHLMSASTASSKAKTDSFQYIPMRWTEVYAAFEERWIAVDCIQGCVEERNRLENKTQAHSFVLAVDIDGRIHDLTRKYAADYDGKSFRLRKDEDKWLTSCLAQFNARASKRLIGLIDRETESSSSTESEIEIPKTIAAIKNHPTIMLASQLKKYEVFYPVTQPIGFFKDEPVYLRANVQKVRSRDAWLSQCARVLKEGEEPIKLVNLPRKAGAPESEPTGVQPLFGEWQTEPYKPPLVIDGKIPKNDHGNVDLFQPSMLPAKCVHVTLPGAWKVAKHLKIDYADACIGFSFHGGRAVPSIHGIVLTEEAFPAFESKYKQTLVESLQRDADELEKSMAMKWVKIIKNALIARRLKHDSSVSLSELQIDVDAPAISNSKGEPLLAESSATISAFSKSSTADDKDHEEIDGFDDI